MPQNDLTGYLKAVPTDDNTRAQAWEVFNNPANQQDFEQRVSKLNLPQQAKADLWEAKYGSGKLNSPPAQPSSPISVTPTVQPKIQPSAQPASPAGKSIFGKVWDWANAPLNVGAIRQGIKEGDEREEQYNAPPTIAEADQLNRENAQPLNKLYHSIPIPGLPSGSLQSQGKDLLHLTDEFGNAVAKTILTPLSAALALTGPLGEEGGIVAKTLPAVAKTARVINTTAALGFAGKGVHDQVKKGVLKQPGESTADYLTRTAGNSALVLGAAGVSGHNLTGHSEAEAAPAAASEQPTTGTSSTVPAPVVTPEQVAQARIKQAVGSSTTPSTQTIHVDPAFAEKMDQWNQSDLPNKRVILKNGKVTLAHTDGEAGGFKYTNTGAPNKFSETPVDGQVPVDLSTTNGTSGTSAPGHFLTAKIGNSAPTPAQAVPEPAPTTPIESVPDRTVSPKVVVPADPTRGVGEVKLDTLDEPTTPVAGGVKPGTKPVVTLPGGIPLSEKGTPLSILQDAAAKFAEPETLTPKAPTLLDSANKAKAVLRPNLPKAEDVFSGPPDDDGDELRKAREILDKPLKAEASTRGSKGLVPSDAIDSLPKKPQALTPPVSAKLTKIEDDIRPLVGQVKELNKLQRGSQANDIIDRAIRESSKEGGSLDPRDEEALSRFLKEPVEGKLSDEQVAKAEALRGGKLSENPKITVLSPDEVERNRYGQFGEAFERQLDLSKDRAIQVLSDPNAPSDLKAKIQDLWERGVDFKYEKGLVYPDPVKLTNDHPESPFGNTILGHDIVGITSRNKSAALGTQPKNLFSADGNKENYSSKYITPQEFQHLRDLENQVKNENRQESGSNLSDELEGRSGGNLERRSARAQLAELSGSGNSANLLDTGRTAAEELREYRQSLLQKALAGDIKDATQALKTKIGEWNKQRGDSETELTKQLSALPPEVRKYLPSELFDYEKSNGATTGKSVSSAQPKKSLSTARTSSPKPSAFKPGAETPYEGIRTNKWEGAIRKQYPTEAQQIPLLQEAIHERFPLEERQKTYDRVTETYARGISQGLPDALKVALDIIVHRGEAGYLDIGGGKGDPVLSPEQNRAANLDSSNRILSRWEAMSDSELIRKGEGLRSSDLQARVDGTFPTATDPTERLAQMEQHNEILARYQALKEKAGTSKNIFHSMMDWARSFTEPNFAEQTIRGMQGTKNRDIAIQKQIFDSADKLMESLPVAEKDRIWDAMQNGARVDDKLNGLMDPKLVAKFEKENGKLPDINEMISNMRVAMDAAREEYSLHSGNLQEFIVNYMPGMYENAGRARVLGMEGVGRQPLAGNADFLKQKIYEFQKDALRAGLQPVTNNPIRAGLSLIAQLKHASFAYKLRNRFVDAGDAHWVPNGETAPTGWVSLDDRIFGERGRGQYFAPSAVADRFNNFVSQGLKGKWLIPNTSFSVYDAIRNSNNIQNMSQLSFSFFHGSDVIANSFLSSIATSAQRVIDEGVFGGRIGKTPVQRVQAVASGLGQFLQTPVSPIIDWAKGRNIELNWHDPTKQMQYAQMTSDIEQANANVRPDLSFHLEQAEKMKNAWATAMDSDRSFGTRANAVRKAVIDAAGAVPEISSYPLMKSVIPAMKLGALDRAFEQVHREFAGESPDVVQSELQKAADSIDNRFGEMNWDNIFWNRTVKDIGQLFGRAPGWALGTGREIGGGLRDLPATVKDIATGQPVHISSRTAYIGAMIAGTMMWNAVRQYLNTGKKAEGIDYFYPQNGTVNAYGEPNREYPKFLYTYEGINWYHDPLGTAQHKLAPGFATASDIAKNEDYYHHEIYDPADSTPEKFKKSFGYMAQNFLPFSVQNMKESELRGGKASVASLFGVMPAPQWVGRTQAQNLAFTYYQGMQGSAGKDDSTFEKQRNFVLLRNQVQAGTLSPEQLQKAINTGKIQPSMLKYLYATVNKPPIVTWTGRLNSEAQVWNVWQAATNQEKQQLLPTVLSKMSRLSSGDKQTYYLNELEKFANSLSDDDRKKLTTLTTTDNTE